jgi:hypothetical protein
VTVLACRLLGYTNDVSSYMEAHQTLLDMTWTHLVAGHVDRPGSREDVTTQLEYVNDLMAATRTARSAPDTADAFVDIPQQYLDNPWALGSAYQQRVSNACYNELVAKWGSRLGGADVWGRSHCDAMNRFINVEGAA